MMYFDLKMMIIAAMRYLRLFKSKTVSLIEIFAVIAYLFLHA